MINIVIIIMIIIIIIIIIFSFLLLLLPSSSSNTHLHRRQHHRRRRRHHHHHQHQLPIFTVVVVIFVVVIIIIVFFFFFLFLVIPLKLLSLIYKLFSSSSPAVPFQPFRCSCSPDNLFFFSLPTSLTQTAVHGGGSPTLPRSKAGSHLQGGVGTVVYDILQRNSTLATLIFCQSTVTVM